MSTITHASHTHFAGVPLLRCWDANGAALPRRAIRMPAPAARRPVPDAPPWLVTGPHHEPFDFCGHVQRLCADIAARSAPLRHVQVDRILFAVTQARSGRRHGLQARVTPLRFANGDLTRPRRGVPYQVQRYVVGGREILYLMTFCLPRFLDQDFDEKFVTLFHELFHIGPACDGDLRRHPGRCSVHSHSKRAYDAHMAELAREYLAAKPDTALYDFLRLNFAQLQHRHGKVVGVVVPQPKVVPLVHGE